MPKKTCEGCGGLRDVRARRCNACRSKLAHPRLGSGKGWYLHSTGYVIGCIAGRALYQHRYVMEQHLGRRLESKECVHHINHDRTDNRLENLELISASEHGRRHLLERDVCALARMGANARWGERHSNL